VEEPLTKARQLGALLFILGGAPSAHEFSPIKWVLPHDNANQQIVPAEPHSTTADFRDPWDSMPRWRQIILLLAIFAGGFLVSFFLNK
jgi:hypothetical protein